MCTRENKYYFYSAVSKSDMTILTVRWFDSNWWHTLIKQSYLYKKNISWTCIYYCNQIACMCTVYRVRATRVQWNEDGNDNTTMVRSVGEKSTLKRNWMSETTTHKHTEMEGNQKPKWLNRKYMKKSTNIDPRPRSRMPWRISICWRKVKALTHGQTWTHIHSVA